MTLARDRSPFSIMAFECYKFRANCSKYPFRCVSEHRRKWHLTSSRVWVGGCVHENVPGPDHEAVGPLRRWGVGRRHRADPCQSRPLYKHSQAPEWVCSAVTHTPRDSSL